MPLSIALASADLAERLITTLMPVVLVKAASMSSSAFFIDTAAYTVTVLSCACAGRAAVRAKSSARAVHLSMAILVQTSRALPWFESYARPRLDHQHVPAKCGLTRKL